MGLSEEQKSDVEALAELAVRRHMAELFDQSLPRIVQAAFAAHNADGKAHEGTIKQHALTCPVAKKLDRVLWVSLGLALATGLGGGSLLMKLIG